MLCPWLVLGVDLYTDTVPCTRINIVIVVNIHPLHHLLMANERWRMALRTPFSIRRIESDNEIPTMKRKKGITASARWNPDQGA